MKRIVVFLATLSINSLVVWFSWDYIMEYIPIIQNGISGLFHHLSGMILSTLPLLLILFIIFSILNN